MSDEMKVDLADVDLFARGEHHAAFRWLRDNAPVHWNAGDGGFWALTRYDDVLAGYRDHATFSSSGGVMLGGSFRSAIDTAAGRMLVASDPPRHRLLRQQMHPAFAEPFVERVEAEVRRLVDVAVTELVRRGGGDFAVDVAPELPTGALMATLAIGRDDARHLIDLTRQMIGFRDPEPVDSLAPAGGGTDERVRLVWIQSEIFDFFSNLMRDRRARPGDDAVSILLRAELNGRPMSTEDIVYNCLNIAVGGNETSSHTFCAAVEALADNPDQYERLLRQQSLLDSALAEILRWSSVNAYVQRSATRDVEIHGARIRAGDRIALWNVSANRDERQFPRADAFDVERSPNRHLSFGTGIHRCVGAPIGQAEVRTALERLVRGRVRFVLAGPVQRVRSNFILGYTSVPVEIG